MHVLIIPSWYPAYPGDVNGCFFREQAIALHKAGCKVGIIYPQHRSLRQWKTIFNGHHSFETSDDCGVHTYQLHGINWFPRLAEMQRRTWIRACLNLYKKYTKEQGQPDVIHVHSILNAGFVAEKINEKYKIPFIITEHSTAYARNLVTPKEIKSAQRVSEKAEKLIGVSTEFCSLLEKIFQSNKNWQYIPNIVNESFFGKNIIKQKNNEFQFINIALASDKKKQSNILHAIALKFKEKKNIKLIIGGDGPELERLRKLANTLGITDQVKFLGKLTRDQVLTAMSQANAFVLSSHYETFGVVVIEALALGLPVVATRCGGPESIVREQDGLLVPVDDIESLGAAMQTIFENFDQYNPERIRQACRERFSEEIIARRLIDIYKEISAGQPITYHAN